jgi:hypothetical protein
LARLSYSEKLSYVSYYCLKLLSRYLITIIDQHANPTKVGVTSQGYIGILTKGSLHKRCLKSEAALGAKDIQCHGTYLNINMVNSMITNSRLNFKFSCYEEVRQRSLKGKMVGTVEHMKGRNIYVLSDVTIQNVYEFNDRVVNEFRRSRRSEQILQQNSC